MPTKMGREEEKEEFHWNPEGSLRTNLLKLAKYCWTRKVAKSLYIALGGYLLLSAVSKVDDRVITQDTQHAPVPLSNWRNPNAILYGVSDAELGKKAPTRSLISETGNEIAITISDDNSNQPSNANTISYKEYSSGKWKENTISGSSPTHELEIDGETYEISVDINSELQVKKVMDTWEVLTFKVKDDRVTFWNFEGQDCNMWWSPMACWRYYYYDKSNGQWQSTYCPTWDQENKINACQERVINIWKTIKYQVLNLLLWNQAA